MNFRARHFLPKVMLLFVSNTMLLEAFANENFSFNTAKQEEYTKYSNRLGHINHYNQYQLAFKSSGYLINAPLDVGDSFKVGQSLAKLDVQELTQQKLALSSELNFIQQEITRIVVLHQDGLISDSDKNAFDNQYEQVVTSLEQVNYLIEKSNITATFSGQVVHRHTEVGELVQINQPVYTVISEDNTWINTLNVTHDERVNLSLNEPLNFRLTNDSKVHSGRIVRLAMEPTAGSNLYRVDIKTTTNSSFVKGLTTQTQIPIKQSLVYKVSHLAPIKISNNMATLLVKQPSSELKHQHFQIIDIDDEFFYLKADKPTLNYVTNGWIVR